MQGYDKFTARGSSCATGTTRVSSAASPSSPRCRVPHDDGAARGIAHALHQTRAKKFFERTLELFNLHGVEPVLVIMPYHPAALDAFRAVGWQTKADAFKAYLESLRGTYRFHLLDYTDIASFHGSRTGSTTARTSGPPRRAASSRRPSGTRRPRSAERGGTAGGPCRPSPDPRSRDCSAGRALRAPAVPAARVRHDVEQADRGRPRSSWRRRRRSPRGCRRGRT